MKSFGTRRFVRANGRTVAVLVPLSSDFHFRSGRVRPSGRYVLSRFAYCRRVGRDLILESPLSAAHLILLDAVGIACLAAISSPCRASDLSAAIPKLTVRAALQFLNLLSNAGALSEVDEEGNAVEDRDSALSSWEFHDLVFHSRSRVGRHGNPYGRVERTAGVASTSNQQEPGETSGLNLDLYRPDIETLRKKDSPFTFVLENRRSRRAQGVPVMTDRQLGEFLFRSARVCNVTTGGMDRVERRPYPCSGAAYELELYPLVRRCSGIRPGLYRYDPSNHRLCRISGRTAATQQILKSAAAAARAQLPQLLIVIGARFQRVNLHYGSIAYASILKDVGALFQTFYLVASAMGLSACALGAGDSDLFAAAAGLNYYTETSVGEFMLGSA